MYFQMPRYHHGLADHAMSGDTLNSANDARRANSPLDIWAHPQFFYPFVNSENSVESDYVYGLLNENRSRIAFTSRVASYSLWRGFGIGPIRETPT